MAAPPPLLPSGHVAAGRYEIIRLIGAGGASEVSEAFDRGLGVNVALKVLDPIQAQSAEKSAPGPRAIPVPPRRGDAAGRGAPTGGGC